MPYITVEGGVLSDEKVQTQIEHVRTRIENGEGHQLPCHAQPGILFHKGCSNKFSIWGYGWAIGNRIVDFNRN